MRRPSRSSSKARPATTKSEGSLRIIGGQWRGRKLRFNALDGLRPTGDRIRETLFNWLQSDVPAARCLDLFAGSGALGLEALSRGAREVIMLDRQRPAVTQLQQHCTTLAAEGARVIEADALQWLRQASLADKTQGLEDAGQGFDIVFIDPPFDQDLWQNAFEALDQGHLLNPGAAIYIESPRRQPLTVPPSWQLHREKNAGQVSYQLYYYQPEDIR